jgi:hypothetical protein
MIPCLDPPLFVISLPGAFLKKEDTKLCSKVSTSINFYNETNGIKGYLSGNTNLIGRNSYKKNTQRYFCRVIAWLFWLFLFQIMTSCRDEAEAEAP